MAAVRCDGASWGPTQDASACLHPMGSVQQLVSGVGPGVGWGRGSILVGRIDYFRLPVPGTEKLGSFLKP